MKQETTGHGVDYSEWLEIGWMKAALAGVYKRSSGVDTWIDGSIHDDVHFYCQDDWI